MPRMSIKRTTVIIVSRTDLRAGKIRARPKHDVLIRIPAADFDAGVRPEDKESSCCYNHLILGFLQDDIRNVRRTASPVAVGSVVADIRGHELAQPDSPVNFKSYDFS